MDTAEADDKTTANQDQQVDNTIVQPESKPLLSEELNDTVPNDRSSNDIANARMLRQEQVRKLNPDSVQGTIRKNGSNVPIQQQILPRFAPEKTEGMAVGVTIGQLPASCTGILGMVKPIVKIHAVDINTGHYISSAGRHTSIPLSTRGALLPDFYSKPVWNQELVLDAHFKDIVTPSTVLLFELLDDRPSLNMKKKTSAASSAGGGSGDPPEESWWSKLTGSSSATNAPVSHNQNANATAGVGRAPKKIAWAFLYPMSTHGGLNVGIPSEWTTQTSLRAAQANIKSRKTRRTDGSGDNDAADDNTLVFFRNDFDMKLRLQMFAYQEEDSFICPLQRAIMGWPAAGRITKNNQLDIPEVYFQWRRQRRIALTNTMLETTLGPRSIVMAIGTTPAIGRLTIDASGPGEAAMLAAAAAANVIAASNSNLNNPKSEFAHKLRAIIMRRSRPAKEPCIVPDRLLHRLQVGPSGAMVIQYSHSGHLLAIAAKAPSVQSLWADITPTTTPDCLYSLRLFDTDLGCEVWSETVAHYGVVYDLKWTLDDSYLMTCSADGSAKVWDVACLLPSFAGAGALQKQLAMGVSFMMSPTGDSPKSPAGADLAAGAGVADELGSAGSKSSLRQTLPTYFPQLVYTLSSSPPVFVYCAIFQEYALPPAVPASPEPVVNSSTENFHLSDFRERSKVPPIITGSSDGRIRMWDAGRFERFIDVSPLKKEEGRGGVEQSDGMLADVPKFGAHSGCVNSLVIDTRSRYLLSGDSNGEMFVWRTDNKGQYQLLRKFKKDKKQLVSEVAAQRNGVLGSERNAGVMSMTVHPERSKAQMLVMSHGPNQLRLFNLASYRAISTCSGYDGVGGVFARATLSADGSIAVCGTCVKNGRGVVEGYKLTAWDAMTGNQLRSQISEYLLPYPIRCMSWHPRQHVLAVAMVGNDACVSVYCADREDAERVCVRANAGAVADGPNSDNNNNNSNVATGQDSSTLNSETAPVPSEDKESVKLLKAEKARLILEKLRAAREVTGK